MANNGLWKYVDQDHLGPPVDYHEVRGHLRLGTVIVHDKQLRKKILHNQPVDLAEDVAIRNAVYNAILNIAGFPEMPTPMALHYLFWNIFRNVCRRENPYCRKCPGDIDLPSRYLHLLQIGGQARQCPFLSVCPSADIKDRYVEHRFETEWY